MVNMDMEEEQPRTTTAINLTDESAIPGPANVFSKLVNDTGEEATRIGNEHGRKKYQEQRERGEKVSKIPVYEGMRESVKMRRVGGIFEDGKLVVNNEIRIE